MKPIVRIENLSKSYTIGGSQAPYGNLRETMSRMAQAPFRRLRGEKKSPDETIWALRDIEFEVQAGEVLGLVGRNGAGKSTLLKILSRITEPTTGRIELFGRVGSLLEVGTGFHPELSGRENVYLSGAILGMGRNEIQKKFDEIVAFSEIEKFLDTPVKRYSSGMYVRLAFAVAAHMDPEILLIDEVLAVGDISFQKKCLNHMRRLKQKGITILLVSHNMAAIQGTCERSVLLHDGRVAAVGASEAVVRQYRDNIRATEAARAKAHSNGNSTNDESALVITGFDMWGLDGESRRTFQFGEEARIRIELFAKERIDEPLINFGIRRGDGVIVCNFNNLFDNFRIDYIEGNCTLEGWLPPLRLIPHYYEIHVLVWRRLSGFARGDLSGLQPMAYRLFGDFCIEGPPLTDQDGVFQQPASKWVFVRGERRIEYTAMGANSLADSYAESANLLN